MPAASESVSLLGCSSSLSSVWICLWALCGGQRGYPFLHRALPEFLLESGIVLHCESKPQTEQTMGKRNNAFTVRQWINHRRKEGMIQGIQDLLVDVMCIITEGEASKMITGVYTGKIWNTQSKRRWLGIDIEYLNPDMPTSWDNWLQILSKLLDK